MSCHVLRRLGAAWRRRQPLIRSLAGIIEPPQFALPRAPRILAKHICSLAQLLADRAKGKVFVVMARNERSRASLGSGTRLVGTTLANDTSMDVLPR